MRSQAHLHAPLKEEATCVLAARDASDNVLPTCFQYGREVALNLQRVQSPRTTVLGSGDLMRSICGTSTFIFKLLLPFHFLIKPTIY